MRPEPVGVAPRSDTVATSTTSPSGQVNGPSLRPRYTRPFRRASGASQLAIAEQLQGSVDPRLLLELPVGGVVPRLAGPEHTAEAHVPVPGVDVLPVGSAVHDQLAAGGEHGDVAGSVACRGAAGAHLGSG